MNAVPRLRERALEIIVSALTKDEGLWDVLG